MKVWSPLISVYYWVISKTDILIHWDCKVHCLLRFSLEYYLKLGSNIIYTFSLYRIKMQVFSMASTQILRLLVVFIIKSNLIITNFTTNNKV